MSNDSRCMPLPRQDGEAAKDLQELHRCHAWYILVLRQTGLKSCQVSSQKVWHDSCWWFNSWFLYISVSYYTISSQSLYRFIAHIYIFIIIYMHRLCCYLFSLTWWSQLLKKEQQEWLAQPPGFAQGSMDAVTWNMPGTAAMFGCWCKDVMSPLRMQFIA